MLRAAARFAGRTWQHQHIVGEPHMSTGASPVTARRRIGAFRLVVIIGIVAAGIAVAGGLWYLFGRSAPPPVSLSGSGSAAATASSEPAASQASAVGAADLEGTWAVDGSIGSFSDYTGSFVGYRVQEELANIGATTAVGRTPDVDGSLTVDGNAITSVEITADLTTLQSDNNMRDGQLRRQALETDTYPEAMFVLTEPVTLDELPGDREQVAASATGELTIHGTTQSVQVPIVAELVDGVVTVVGSIEIPFADYGIAAPQSMMVLSVDDLGVMEFQLHFTSRACEATDSAQACERPRISLSRSASSGSSFRSRSGNNSSEICRSFSFPACRAAIPRMSNQSRSRPANALKTIRSSALQVVIETPWPIRKAEARSIARSSKGIAPSEMSTATSLRAWARTTRFRSANSRASGRRPANVPRIASTKRASSPNPVRTVRSASRVTRGSPHRCTASPPMKQNRHP
jgi:polyisoprenoid-binding protein YceI